GSLQTRFGVGRQLHGAIGRAGDLGEADRLTAPVAHTLAAGESDVLRFEQHLAELLDLGFELLQRVVERRCADRRAAAAERPDAVLYDSGVAVDYLHVVQAHAELVGGDLGEGGFLALAVRRAAGHHRDGAGGVDLDGSAFPTAGRRRGRRS